MTHGRDDPPGLNEQELQASPVAGHGRAVDGGVPAPLELPLTGTYAIPPGPTEARSGKLGSVNEISLAPPDATAGPTGIVLASIGLFLLVVGLVFGIRDAWISARGVNGSIAGGLAVGLISLLPIACVFLCVAISRRQAQGRSSTLLRAGTVAVVVGLPVALFLVIGAAY